MPECIPSFLESFFAIAARSWNPYAIILTMSNIEITIPRLKTNVLVLSTHKESYHQLLAFI